MMKLQAEKSLFQIPQAEKYLSTILPRLAEKRVQSFTTLTLALITLSFFGIFAISPTLSTIADLQKQITDSQFVNEQLRVKISNLTSLETSYKKVQPDLSYLLDALPINPDVTVLIGQIQTVAQDAQVNLIHIQTLPVEVSGIANVKYNSYAFSLDVSGNYDAIKTFLVKITNFNRLVTLDAISLTRPVAGQDMYSLSLRGKAYFKSQ